ncbi:MAG: DUF1616 domain-containing protein [Halobacteriota archaeon]|nr:DUF1616 domain-containing protein [Halobacteriota archaeon]
MAERGLIGWLSSDMVLVIILMLLSILFTLITPFNETSLRVIFALPILLFLPGYSLVSAMFPRRKDLSGIERFTLGIGMSIVIFVFDGFAISVTEWLFRPEPLVMTLSGITIIFVLITAITRLMTPKEERFEFNLYTISDFFSSVRDETDEPSDIEKALTIALIGSIIIASGMLAYAKFAFEEEEFTELYILGAGGMAENYPTELHLLEPTSITVGVRNYEHAPVNYRLEVWLGDYLIDSRELSLEHDWTWVNNISILPKHIGQSIKLQFILFKEGAGEPYRSTHLWVNSSIDYENLEILEDYSLVQLPHVTNGDMESTENWERVSNSENFRGRFTKFLNFSEDSIIRGYVFDNSTGIPISYASVRLSNNYGYFRSNTTDENGYYELQTIADNFWIESRATGYERRTVNTSVEKGEVLTFNTSNDPVLSFNMTFEELALLNVSIDKLPIGSSKWLFTLDGRITDIVSGLPVDGAEVYIVTSGFEKELTTDGLGRFELTTIPGEIIIVTNAYGYTEDTTELNIYEDTTVDISLSPKSYVVSSKSSVGLLSGLLSVASADETITSEGDGLPSWLSLVRGYVIDNETESPIPYSDVMIISGYGFEKRLTTDDRGYFEVKVISGPSTIIVGAEGYMATRMKFELANVTDINLRLDSENSIVRGYVFDNQTGKTIPKANVGVYRDGYRNRTSSNSTGYFELKTIAGDMGLRADKSGYFWNESLFSIDYGEEKMVNISLNQAPPPSKIYGYVTYNGTVVTGMELHISNHHDFEESAIADESGYYEVEVPPGHLWLNVLPKIYAEEIEFDIGSSMKAPLDVELKGLPGGMYRIQYPSNTMIYPGYSAGLYQDIDSKEGLAALSFKISDSYDSNRSEGIFFKQVLLNDLVIWEDDVAGVEGWEDITIPMTLDEGPNRLYFRLYAKEGAKNYPVTIWLDDVEIRHISAITKGQSTQFRITDQNDGDYLPKNLYLGEPVSLIASVANLEGRYTNYTLQVRMNGYTLESYDIGLENGKDVKHNIMFTPNQIGPLQKLEFLLFKDGDLDKVYKNIDFWVSSEINYQNMDLLKEYEVSQLPVLANGDMESDSGWLYYGSVNITGGYSDAFSTSPSRSYELELRGDRTLKSESYGSIFQEIVMDEGPAVVVVSFSAKDSYISSSGGYITKKLVLNGHELWTDDVAGDELWQHVKVPVTLLPGKNKLELRLSSEREVSGFPIKVWWDDVMIEPVQDVTKEVPTKFSVLNLEGGELRLERLYLGKPSLATVKIENNEGVPLNYALEIRLGDSLIKRENIWLEDGSEWVKNITLIPDIAGDDLMLRFLLFRSSSDSTPYKSTHLMVSSELDGGDMESLLDYEIKNPLPSIDNEDMESRSSWSVGYGGAFKNDYSSRDSTSGNYSYLMEAQRGLNKGDYSTIHQDFTSSSYPGVLIISFNVEDTYTDSNATNISKQVLLNDKVVWEDDLAGDEDWQDGRLPVYITSRDNKLSLRVYAKENFDEGEVRVYWDDVMIKSVSSVV